LQQLFPERPAEPKMLTNLSRSIAKILHRPLRSHPDTHVARAFVAGQGGARIYSLDAFRPQQAPKTPRPKAA
jgi:hypothetical protein